jgi:DNA-directed RNA polymerase subunit A'
MAILHKEQITQKIKSVTFGVLSPREILKQSVLKVITPEIYDRYGFPVEGGLMDLKMGVIEPGLRCKTCGENFKNCEGHFGFLEFSRPILNVLYIDTIYNLLRCISHKSSKLLCTDEQRDIWVAELKKIKAEFGGAEYVKAQVKIMTTLIKTKKCPHTNEVQEDIKLDKSSVFVFTQGDKKRILNTQIRFRFENINDEDLILLGLIGIRPEWLIMTQFPIPPVSMRSSITLKSGQRSEDDLTHKLTDIVRTNQRLHEHLLVGVPETIIEDVWDLLQYHISTYMDNTLAGLPPARHKGGDTIKSVAERIKGKKGIIRNNLIGKRVNFSARTVISPDPKLKLNEVGIPFEVAKRLTIPEKVTSNNIDYLKKLVFNGPLVYPGANYLITKNGAKKRISKEIIDVLLEEITEGYEIHRHLLDGDSAIFNRQPSLHKLSMMGHIVKVLPIKTFAINPGVCKPYNADFDGDEMNLHISQTIEGRQEVERLMDVKHQLISPASGETVIGCIQDSISGLYVLTKDKKTWSKEDAYELLFGIGYDKIEEVDFNDKVKGAEIFSAILPKNLNFVGKSRTGDVVIENGVLKSGIIDKKTIGDGGGTLLRHLHKNYDVELVLELVKYFFNLGIQVLKKTGLTISMADFDVDEEVGKKIDSIDKEVFKQIDKLVESYEKKELKRETGLTIEKTFEIKMLNLLNEVRAKGLTLIETEMDKNSGTMIMNEAGTAKVLSIVQMHTGVGQQSLRGSRITRGYTNRTLSHFKKNDISPKARGYIKSPLKKGLKPYETFFASITGRDGLTDTALRTPKTGYLYRRMAASMLDLTTHTDLTVRSENNSIVQFKYGEDGIDVSKTMNGDFNIKDIVNKVLKNKGGKK